jgi:hypothetical protein
MSVMTETRTLTDKFQRMGARVRIRTNASSQGSVRLDVQSDKKGEFFDLLINAGNDGANTEVSILDVQPQDRHLLLLARIGEGRERVKSKFLCGHDERHWFVAAIPEAAPVGTVMQAKQALKPREIRETENRKGFRNKQRNTRKNEVYLRQGEWFFLPSVRKDFPKEWILCDEPLSRGRGSKPHMAQFCVRTGGETVYVSSLYPNGIGLAAYNALPKEKRFGFRQMVKDAQVFVKGTIRHADHATITLHGWHRVVMNTENQSKAMRHVAFLD